IPFEQANLVYRLWDDWAAGSAGEAGLELSDVEQQVLDAVRAVVDSQQSGAALVRRMPGLIPQLLQSLRSDNFSGAQLSRTISNDVVLVAAVTRLANSSMLGTGKNVASVEHAVMVIGQEGLRQLITSVAFRPIIDMNSGYYTRTVAPRIWDRAERCANANRSLARENGVEPFEAFLAALVQNVGMIVALRIMDQVARDDRTLGSGLFRAQLATLARQLSCSISQDWHFPQSVTHAIREQGRVARGAVMSPLGRLMALSDYMGKLRMLVEHGVVEEGDPALFGRLPMAAPRCYAALETVEEVAG
ncbi:MAG TPA: HDOD domain-containing protein, partial [Telluria sp.]|nr:HDOD domain-containing protein [Telluria sp.]